MNQHELCGFMIWPRTRGDAMENIDAGKIWTATARRGRGAFCQARQAQEGLAQGRIEVDVQLDEQKRAQENGEQEETRLVSCHSGAARSAEPGIQKSRVSICRLDSGFAR